MTGSSNKVPPSAIRQILRSRGGAQRHRLAKATDEPRITLPTGTGQPTWLVQADAGYCPHPGPFIFYIYGISSVQYRQSRPPFNSICVSNTGETVK